MSKNTNYRQLLAEGEIEAGTLLDAIDALRAELYDEVWQKARDMGYGNVTDALVELDRMKQAPSLPAAGSAVAVLLPALRQYRHNCGGDELIPGYDYEETNRIVAALSAHVSVPRELVEDLVGHIEDITCTHDNTHRGGAIWEICDDCGDKWADDRGGKPAFKWPECVEKARALLNEGEPAGQYNRKRIGWELERTAMGDGYYGNALRVAKDIPGLTDQDRAVLDRYATGAQHGTDHLALQDIAMRVYAAQGEGEGQ